jgi:hypothetical protein
MCRVQTKIGSVKDATPDGIDALLPLLNQPLRIAVRILFLSAI